MSHYKTSHYKTSNYKSLDVTVSHSKSLYVTLSHYRLLEFNTRDYKSLQITLSQFKSITDHEVAGSIPGTSTNFKCGLDLERGPPSLVRTIG